MRDEVGISGVIRFWNQIDECLLIKQHMVIVMRFVYS
jgi:hypothetical protein